MSNSGEGNATYYTPDFRKLCIHVLLLLFMKQNHFCALTHKSAIQRKTLIHSDRKDPLLQCNLYLRNGNHSKPLKKSTLDSLLRGTNVR